MKKFDTLKKKQLLKPKKETIKAILDFSKSVEVLKLKDKNLLISKN